MAEVKTRVQRSVQVTHIFAFNLGSYIQHREMLRKGDITLKCVISIIYTAKLGVFKIVPAIQVIPWK